MLMQCRTTKVSGCIDKLYAGLQITVGYRTLADQNLLMSDEIANVVGHDVRTNILSSIILQQQ